MELKNEYSVLCKVCGLRKVFHGKETLENIKKQMKAGVNYSKCYFCGSLVKLKEVVINDFD